MNEQLEQLATLWTHEQARDALIADYKALKDKVAALEGEREERAARLLEAQQALAELKQQEHALNRRLDQATRRRDKTRQLIDLGQVTDYGVAKNQIQQNEDIIDEVETELLELYETIEAASATLSAATNLSDLAGTKLDEARATLETRTPEIRAALNELTPKRDAAREPLAHHLVTRYDLLRKRGRAPLADVRGDGSCAACNVKMNNTQLMEFRRDLGVQHCASCGRFFWRDLG